MIAGMAHCAWVVILTGLKNMADCPIIVNIIGPIIVNIMEGFGRPGHVSKYIVFSLTSPLWCTSAIDFSKGHYVNVRFNLTKCKFCIVLRRCRGQTAPFLVAELIDDILESEFLGFRQEMMRDRKLFVTSG